MPNEYHVVHYALPATPESQHHDDVEQRARDDRRAALERQHGPEFIEAMDQFERDVARRMLGIDA